MEHSPSLPSQLFLQKVSDHLKVILKLVCFRLKQKSLMEHFLLKREIQLLPWKMFQIIWVYGSKKHRMTQDGRSKYFQTEFPGTAKRAFPKRFYQTLLLPKFVMVAWFWTPTPLADKPDFHKKQRHPYDLCVCIKMYLNVFLVRYYLTSCLGRKSMKILGENTFLNVYLNLRFLNDGKQI